MGYRAMPSTLLLTATLLLAACAAAAAEITVERDDAEITVANSALSATFGISKSCGTLTGLHAPGGESVLTSAVAASLYYAEQEHWVSEAWLRPSRVDVKQIEGAVMVTFDCDTFGGFRLRKSVTIREGSAVLQVAYHLQALEETRPQLIGPARLALAEGIRRFVTTGGEGDVSSLEVKSLALEVDADWFGFTKPQAQQGVVIAPLSRPEGHGADYLGRSADDGLSLVMRVHPMRVFSPGEDVRFAYNLALVTGEVSAAAEAATSAGAGPIEELEPLAVEAEPTAEELSDWLRVAYCPPASAAPQIDGRLDDDAWQNAGVADRFMIARSGAPAEGQTTAHLAHDQSALYIGVRCEEPMMQQVQTNALPGSGRIWTDDCVEIFIDPDGDGLDYAHLIVNAAGLQQDNLPAERAAAKTWQAAATKAEDHWSVEIAIPFADLERALPETGDAWRLNIARSRLPEREASCWSPTFANFHVPERFGVVAFGRPAVQVTRIATGFADKARERTARIEVRNTGDEPGEVAGQVRIARQGAGEDAAAVAVAAAVAPGAREVVEATYTLPQPGAYTMLMDLGTDGAAGTVLDARFAGTIHSMGLNSAIFPAEKDNNRLMVAKGTTQHLFFIPGNHSGEVYEQFDFVLTLPEGIDVLQVSGDMRGLYYQPTLQSRETVERDGRSMVRWVWTADHGLGLRQIDAARFYNSWCAALVPDDGLAEGQYPFFFNLQSGDDVEPEHAGTLEIMPAPDGGDLEHLTIGMSCWTMDPTMEFWTRALDTYDLCGINMVDAWMATQSGEWSGPAQERGMAVWRMLWWFWWNEEYLDEHPDHAAVSAEGEADEKMVCPEIMASEETDAIAGLMAPAVEHVAAGRYRGLWWDLEGPGTFKYCFCHRCLAGFRERAGIAEETQLTPMSIQAEHADAWIDFACEQSARIAARMKSYAAAHDTDVQIAIYSAVQNEHTRRTYRVDWTSIAPVIDVATPSFYSKSPGDLATTFTEGNREFVDLVTGIKEMPVWNTLSVGHGRGSHYISDGRITQMQIVKSVAWGADGTAQWWWGPTDGRHYHAYANATRTLAAIEDFFVHGEMREDLLTGDPVAGSTRVAWQNGDELLVMLFNDTTGGPIEATATIPEGYSIARFDKGGLHSLDGRDLRAEVAPIDCRWFVISR